VDREHKVNEKTLKFPGQEEWRSKMQSFYLITHVINVQSHVPVGVRYFSWFIMNQLVQHQPLHI
jgi:hypothetical protein